MEEGRQEGKTSGKSGKKQPAAAAAAPAGAKRPQAKGKAKAAGKAGPAKPAVVEEEEEKEPEPAPPVVEVSAADVDDWEVAVAGPKKNAKRRERIQEQKEVDAQAVAPKQVKQKAIPGMAPEGAAAGATPLPQSAAAVPASKGLKLTAEQEKAADAAASMSVPVKVPEKMIGRIIGPKGATLKLIQEKTGVTKIDTSGEIFTLLGPSKAVALAELAIKEICEKGYTSLQYEDFNQAYVQVHPSMFPEIIGKQGCVIRRLKEELGVEVSIPEVPRDAVTGKKKFKVTLAGSADSVQKAKEALQEILTVYHSPITHPDQVHEEIDVEPWQLNWIIGKRGSEIKHIQHNYKVRLYIPNEHSLNKTTILVGEQPNVERAKAYIEKLLWASEAVPKGREAASGAYDGDAWGEEEEHEDWMDGYLYKRR